MADYRRYEGWRRAHSFNRAVYGFTSRFPVEEKYGLTAQLRRSTSSIPANLAEGFGSSDRERARFVNIAIGSAAESDYQLFLAREPGYLSDESSRALVNPLTEIRKMLAGLRKRLVNR